MSNTVTSSPFRVAPPTPSRAEFSTFTHFLKLIFFRGPKVLMTSRINAKCAIIMAIMCMPSLLICSILTIPEMIFQSPYQHAYFYFAKALNGDPTRWVVLFLAAICTLLSLAMPATIAPSKTPIRY